MLRLLVLTLFAFSGCAPLEHLDQLFVLGDYAREKDNQGRSVKFTNAHYDKLLKAIADGSIRSYKDKVSFVNAIGQPIFKKDLPDGSQEWLYRYAVLKTAKDKVYIYFDREGHLVKWEKAPCPSFF